MDSIQEEQCVYLCLTFLWLFGLQPTRLFYSWDFPGKNAGACCHFLSRRSSWSTDGTCISCLAGRFFTADLRGSPERSRRSAKTEGWRKGELIGHIFWLTGVDEKEGGGSSWESTAWLEQEETCNDLGMPYKRSINWIILENVTARLLRESWAPGFESNCPLEDWQI